MSPTRPREGSRSRGTRTRHGRPTRATGSRADCAGRRSHGILATSHGRDAPDDPSRRPRARRTEFAVPNTPWCGARAPATRSRDRGQGPRHVRNGSQGATESGADESASVEARPVPMETPGARVKARRSAERGAQAVAKDAQAAAALRHLSAAQDGIPHIGEGARVGSTPAAQPGKQALDRLKDAIKQARAKRAAIDSRRPPHADHAAFLPPHLILRFKARTAPSSGVERSRRLGARLWQGRSRRGRCKFDALVGIQGVRASAASHGQGCSAGGMQCKPPVRGFRCRRSRVSRVDMSECAFEELLSCIGEEMPRGKLNTIQARQLRKVFDLACARGGGSNVEPSVTAVDGDGDARPSEPADEPSAICKWRPSRGSFGSRTGAEISESGKESEAEGDQASASSYECDASVSRVD